MYSIQNIQGYEGKYGIDIKGNIYSFISKIFLKPAIRNGYLFVNFGGKNHYIHRLLARTFIPNPMNLPCVNHKDGNKLNNALDNIEWCTYQYNLIHARKNGLNKTTKNHVSFKKLNARKVSQYSLCGDFIECYESAIDAQRKTGISRTVIGRVCQGIGMSAGGYFWKFII